MKNFMILTATVATSLFGGCKEECNVYTLSTEMKVRQAEMTVNDIPVASGAEAVKSADIRLKMTCIFSYFDHGTYPEGITEDSCGRYETGHMYSPLESVTLTCNRTIANIPAGEDLIAVMSPKIYMGEVEMTVPAWKNALNEGRFDAVGGPYAYSYLMLGMPYEFDLAFLPYYVSVEPGSYDFTFTVRTGYYNNYHTLFTRTYTGVNLK